MLSHGKCVEVEESWESVLSLNSSLPLHAGHLYTKPPCRPISSLLFLSFKNFLKRFIIFMSVGIFACIYVYVPCAWCPGRPEESDPDAGATDGCECHVSARNRTRVLYKHIQGRKH